MASPKDNATDTAQLRQDLLEAVDTMNWQRRVIGRYRALLCVCETENRAPTQREIAEAMGFEEQRLAA